MAKVLDWHRDREIMDSDPDYCTSDVNPLLSPKTSILAKQDMLNTNNL